MSYNMGKKIHKIDFIRDVIIGIPKDAEIVPRSKWGAKPALAEFKPLKHPVEVLWFIYNTETKQCTTANECEKSIRAYQRKVQRTGKLADIPFNFMVGGDERIYEVRGWFHEPPESKLYPETNGRRMEIGYLGSVPREQVTDLTESAAVDAVGIGVTKKYIKLRYKYTNFDKIGVPLPPESKHKDVVADGEEDFEKEVEKEGSSADCYDTDGLEAFYRDAYPNDVLDKDGKVIGKYVAGEYIKRDF